MTGHHLGVDLGSTTAKAVIVDDHGAMLGTSVVQMGAVSRQGMQRAVDRALAQAGIGEAEVSGTVSTGYGRKLVPGVRRTFTEITCHARGTAALCPGVKLIIDIGGQDSKAITVDESGLVNDFAMNDRCASGTGRFYEVLARALECDLGDLGDLARQGTADLEVSSMCATFAETEIVSMLAQGLPTPDIAASVHRAIAGRTLALVAQVGRHAPVVMTGGVARNPAAVEFLASALQLEVQVPEHPQITGAYGAALLALESASRPVDPTPPGQDADTEVALFPDAHSAAGHSCAGCDGTAGGAVHLGASISIRRT
ncbi:acyl-CoA dehydratase activase [Amycolatopsis saalfeldensis]|uniref:CoA-substrate-specific enzyme activase, putative n=1 Tax=Amycolatopsis saalfeldensis TaxID=394193 RepID=A0A1H8Y8Z3_9PSEU|nr:acyl-CoA dehydratase activase [Amycolatopsis saalfeldensis]SEP48744.1 CoA-substrate-specific enzyme activase, putative [Amycolatopsis saalfeldensis]